MKNDVHIYLYGSLKKKFGTETEEYTKSSLEHPKTLEALVEQLGIPKKRIQLVMINHKAAMSDAIVHPGDRIAIFPPEYPIFADWMGYRHCI